MLQRHFSEMITTLEVTLRTGTDEQHVADDLRYLAGKRDHTSSPHPQRHAQHSGITRAAEIRP